MEWWWHGGWVSKMPSLLDRTSASAAFIASGVVLFIATHAPGGSTGLHWPAPRMALAIHSPGGYTNGSSVLA